MNVTYYGFEPNTFTIKKGVPVRWVINGVSITGCNNRIIVPAYGLEFDVRRGEQVIEFTPTEVGEVRWSCWMGMIPGKFVVVE
jgi:plastocyanin domain-containing protein